MSDILTMNKNLVDANGRPIVIPTVDEVEAEDIQSWFYLNDYRHLFLNILNQQITHLRGGIPHLSCRKAF